MIHYIKQVEGVTYIYSSDVCVGAPSGFVRVKFINDDQAVDDGGRVYNVHRFVRMG